LADDLFVAKVDATDGDGVWAINGGGDGMEYFWGMGMDAAGGIYISGYSRSTTFVFGEQSMANAMSSLNGGDGQNTIYTIKLSSTTTMPSCLSSCSLPLSPAAGTCFIDHHCIADGTQSTYGAHQCFTCNSSANALGWSGPDTSAHCFIGGQCIADGTARPGTGYRAPPSACEYCDASRSTTAWSRRPSCEIEYGWSDCRFPSVDWLVTDVGRGTSATQKVAHLGSSVYLAGYTTGNHSVMSSVSSQMITRIDSDSHYDMHITEVSVSGEPTRIWAFSGSDATKDYWSDLHKFADGSHLAAGGRFGGNLSVPGGPTLVNTRTDPIAFFVKLNTASGNVAWVVSFDAERGTGVGGVDGDSSGNMIITYSTCVVGTTPELRYGRPTGRLASDCTYHVAKLAAADGSTLWTTALPSEASVGTVRVASDGSIYTAGRVSGTATFGSVTLSVSAASGLLLKLDSSGTPVYAKAVASSIGDMDLSSDSSMIAVIGSLSGGLGSFVASLSPATGDVAWQSSMPYLRGVEITDDNANVVVFGQVTGSSVSYTLTDTVGHSTTLRSYGSCTRAAIEPGACVRARAFADRPRVRSVRAQTISLSRRSTRPTATACGRSTAAATGWSTSGEWAWTPRAASTSPATRAPTHSRLASSAWPTP